MAKPNNAAHRKQVLKQRRADEQRQWDRTDARELYQDAKSLLSKGEAPGADRALRKAALLDPDWAGPLVLLAQIHINAGHNAEALAYLRRARKLDDDPMTLYNIGVIHYQLGQLDAGVEAMSQFLAATEKSIGTQWPKLRQSAAMIVAMPRAKAKPVEKPPAPPPPPTPTKTPVPAAKPETPPETPRVNVQFFPVDSPAFETRGTVADYFLRRRWIELRLAQRFE